MLVAGLIIVALTVVRLVMSGILSLIPAHIFAQQYDISGISSIVKIAFIFVPSSMFAALIHTVVFWYIARLSYAVIEWLIKKIPFIGIE